jgi:hypothetical protein
MRNRLNRKMLFDGVRTGRRGWGESGFRSDCAGSGVPGRSLDVVQSPETLDSWGN